MPRKPKEPAVSVEQALAVLGPTLVLLRHVRGVTQKQVAFETGLGRCNLSRIEHGHQVPEVPTLLAYLRATRTNLAQFGDLLQGAVHLGGEHLPPTPREVARALRLLRQRAGLAGRELGAIAGIGGACILRLERGDAAASTEQLLRVLLDGFESNLQEFQQLTTSLAEVAS